MNFGHSYWFLPPAASEGGEGGEGGGGSVSTKSLRFDGGSTSHLYRSLGSTDTTWTLSFWMKRVYVTTPDTNNRYAFSINDSSGLYWAGSATGLMGYYDGSGVTVGSALYRDPTAWMHCAVVCDSSTTDVYINGSIAPNMSGISMADDAVDEIRFGNYGTSSSHSVSQYLHDIYFVEGSAVTPVGNFIETDSTSGVIKPKVYDLSGDGSNSFHLDFDDSSDIGNDVGGNDNDFTATNLGSHDVVPDIPTNNYATWNPLTESAATYSEGNTEINCNFDSINGRRATMELSSGKWYWEVLRLDAAGNVGVYDCSKNTTSYYAGWAASDYGMSMMTAGYRRSSSLRSTSNTTTTDDIVQFALDVDSGKLWIGKNGTWFESGDPSSGTDAIYDSDISGRTWSPSVGQNHGTTSNFVLNAGQDPTFAGNKTSGQDTTQSEFYHAPPSGFKSLCSTNLSAAIADPSAYFQTKTFDDGDGAKTFDGNSDLQPDLVWLKSRGSSNSHKLVDSVRGVEIALSSDGTDAEATESDGLTAFGTDGFTVGDNSDYDDETGDGMVAWGWKEGATQGFDIVTYDGNDNDANMGGPQSISHGLGVKPDMILIKARLGEAYNDNSDNGDWIVWHSSLASDNHYLHLNTTDDVDTTDDSGSFFEKFLDNITTSSFDVGNGGGETSGNYHLMNWDGTAGEYGGSLEKYVAYCFSAVAGYSAFGSYTGNGSTDGPVVHLGFRPAFLMVKNITSSGSGYDWIINDSSRTTYNHANSKQLTANGMYMEGYEGSGSNISHLDLSFDFLSNGFKVRNSYAGRNTSGDTYIYAAFAEAPAKYSLAR